MLSGLLCGERGKRWSVLLLAREEVKSVREWLAQPRKVTQAEQHQSFSLDEIYKSETPTAKTIPALNNDFKFFLLQHDLNLILCCIGQNEFQGLLHQSWLILFYQIKYRIKSFTKCK